ncbi:uncharacterized protein LOC111347335 [Stylophora pistillata]|uniref:Chromosome partition protein Smc n=1 Tax=Stylophora pistillata TaxID=50429 RepID=A0A2B4R236_STYPI|nr:uncharacterized protein LOC111347335 [Stylophora pistillata]PFX12414.1 hypothetical protein AWC38_SpisGene23633 [Stylophora pistillata]
MINQTAYLEFRDLRDQNQDLKNTLESKTEKIEVLQREVKDLKSQNDKLKNSLVSKNKEMNALRDKINTLENEKKTLEVEVERLENEFQVSKEENKKREEQITKLTLSYDKVSKKIERMTKDREESKVENKTLKREISDLRDENSGLKKKVDDLQENIQRLEYSERIGSLPLTMGSPTPVEKAAIILGEMRTRVLAMMYQKVHPDKYEDDCSYTLKNIEEDIEDIEDEGARQEAKYKWEELKKKLNWNKSLHPRILKAIGKERNIVAHPRSLTKGLLLQSVEDMEEAGKLRGWMSFSRVNEIINVWELLGQME